MLRVEQVELGSEIGSKHQIVIAPSCLLVRMRSNYLPKFTIALLAVALAVVILSGQSAHVAATSTTPANSPQYYCYDYGYYNYTYYYNPYYYYYYGYPYSYCSYSYTYYPYYYYYYYPYYYSSYYYGYGYPYNYNSYYNYYSTPSNYQLTVATDPSSLGTITGGGSFTSGTSASFSVTQGTVQTSSNTRYVFSHWSGDYSGVGTSGSVTMNGAKKVTAVYQLQYYLSVNVQPQSVPTPQGVEWYNAGDTATVNSPGQTMNADSGSRLVFQGWSIDGQSAPQSATLSVKMDAPHSVTALYTQQYYLKVLTDQGMASGEGWYPAGTTAQIYVSTPANPSYGVSYVFNGWQGDVQSNSQAASVLMDKPKSVVASWRTDSTVLYLTIALVVVAVLVAAGIIGFLARGRNPQQAQAVQLPQPKRKSPEERKTEHTNQV